MTSFSYNGANGPEDNVVLSSSLGGGTGGEVAVYDYWLVKHVTRSWKQKSTGGRILTLGLLSKSTRTFSVPMYKYSSNFMKIQS